MILKSTLKLPSTWCLINIFVEIIFVLPFVFDCFVLLCGFPHQSGYDQRMRIWLLSLDSNCKAIVHTCLSDSFLVLSRFTDSLSPILSFYILLPTQPLLRPNTGPAAHSTSQWMVGLLMFSCKPESQLCSFSLISYINLSRSCLFLPHKYLKYIHSSSSLRSSKPSYCLT